MIMTKNEDKSNGILCFSSKKIYPSYDHIDHQKTVSLDVEKAHVALRISQSRAIDTLLQDAGGQSIFII